MERVQTVVPMGIVDDGDALLIALERLLDEGDEVRGVDQIDVMCALIGQLVEDIAQAVDIHRQPFAHVTDLPVLTEGAAQGTSREKDRARSVAAADARLLPFVQHDFGKNGRFAHGT